MADNTNEVLLRVNVDYADAIKRIADARKQVDELRAAQRQLDTTTDEGRRASAAYAAQIAALNAQIRDNQRAVVQGIQQNNAAAGSYRAMQAEASQLTARIKEMSEADRQSEAGKALIARLAELNAELKEIDASWGVHNREVGNYGNATRNLRGELREMTQQLANLRLAGERDTEEYRNMAEAAAALRDEIDDTNAEIRNMASDTAALDGLTQGFQALVGAAGLYSAAMGLSSESSKEVEETIKQMQIVMGALTSLQAIQNALQKESALMKFRETVLNKVLILQSWALAKAREAEARGTALSSAQSKIFNTIAKANPYLIILTGVLAAVGAYAALTSALGKATVAEKSLQDTRKAVTAETAGELAMMELYAARIREARAGRGDLTEALRDYNERFKEGGELTGKMVATEAALNAELDKRMARLTALKAQEKAGEEIQRLTLELNKKELDFTERLAVAFKAKYTTLTWGAEEAKKAVLTEAALVGKASELTAAIEAQKKAWTDATTELEKYNREQKALSQEKDIERLRLENMADGLARRKALLALSFADERKAAEGNAALLAEIEKKYGRGLLKLTKEFGEEQAAKYYEAESKKIASAQAVAAEMLAYDNAVQARQLYAIQASGYDRMVAEQSQQARELAQKQMFEQQKLDLQKKTLKITSAEYTAAVEAMGLQSKALEEKQAADRERFLVQQVEGLRQMMQYDAAEDIASVRKSYAAAYKDIEQLQSVSEGDRAIMRVRLRKEEEARVTEIKVAAERDRTAVDLEALADNARLRLEKEIEIQEQVIAIRREGNQATAADEAALLSMRKQLVGLNEQAELVEADKSERKKYDIRKRYLQAALEAARGNADEIARINKEMVDLEQGRAEGQQQRLVAYADKATEVFGALSELFTQLGANRVAEAEAENEKEKEALQRRLDAGFISQKEYSKRVAALDKDLADKKAEQARKDAIRNKALAIFDIILSTGTAIMQALKFPPPASFVFSAAAGAIGAAQLATVAAAPLPKAARGMEILGASHSAGGVPIEAEGGEVIINRRSAQMFKPLLSAMNVAGGGVPFTGAAGRSDGGFAVREERRRSAGADASGFADLMADSLKKVQIYTAIEDINKGENLYSQSTDIRRL